MNHKTIGIILANSASAKIFCYDFSEKKLNPMKEIVHPESTFKTSELMSDSAGRYQKSAEPNQGTYEPHTNPKEIEAMKFATELANFIEHDMHAFADLRVIAPGKFQSHLKHKLKNGASEKIHQFVDKDYTKLSAKDLEKHLGDLLNITFKSGSMLNGQ